LGIAAALIALLLVCLGIAIAILFMRSHDVIPCDPRTIGGVALLLRYSNHLNSLFGADFKDLQYNLQRQFFFSQCSTGPTVRYKILRDDVNSRLPPRKEIMPLNEIRGWWRPISLRLWCKIMAILIPLALVAALEALQQLSDRSNGILAIASPDSAHYGTTIIPALVMWTTGAFYSSINFNTILILPYHALSNGGAVASRSIFSRDLGRLPLFQLISCIKQKHVAAVFTTFTAIIGSVLIVIVSALYSTAPGTSSTHPETRLIQNRAPKLALQALLCVIALCVIASWFSMRTGALLPHNPSSIAGAAALLAGGELWRREGVPGRGLIIPEGLEWAKVREVKRKGVWKGVAFGLGWWPDTRFGIDAGGPAQNG
jgi:hypothetical protein